MKKYTVLENGYVTLELNGFLYTIPNDQTNADYQAYLRWLENPDADESGTL